MVSTTGRSGSGRSGRARHGHPVAGVPANEHRVTRRRNRRHVPARDLGDRLGDGVPVGGVPPLGDGHDLAVDPREDEGRELVEAHRRARRTGRGRRTPGNVRSSGPRNARASSCSAVTMKLTRASDPRNSSRIRTADFNTQELSFVYGSSTTLARWNVVNHSLSPRASPSSGASDSSSGSFVATASDRSDPEAGYPNHRSLAYRTDVHPIEHLRYVARARGADSASLVREAATALASLRADSSNLGDRLPTNRRATPGSRSAVVDVRTLVDLGRPDDAGVGDRRRDRRRPDAEGHRRRTAPTRRRW